MEKGFSFKKSALSAKADEMWSQSKSGFSASTNRIQLEKKSLDDVLCKIAADKKESQDKETKPAFVFGSGLSDKVVKGSTLKTQMRQYDHKQAASTQEPAATTSENGDGKTEDKTESVVAANGAHKEEDSASIPSTAAEKPPAVAVTTGEEGDSVLFSTACKIHIFDKDKKTWNEKGLATIKINERFDEDGSHHRIIARTSGTQKVIINSHIFPTMMFERSDSKRIKLSAFGPDSPNVQIYLITIGFSKTDLNIDQFYGHVERLLNDIKRSPPDETSTRKRKASFNTGGFEDESEVKKGRASEEPKEAADDAEESKEVEKASDDAKEAEKNKEDSALSDSSNTQVDSA